MKNSKLIFTLLLLAFGSFAKAQNTHQFKKGLVVEDCHQYGREAIYTDQLAYQLYSKTLKKPAEGQVFLTNEKGKEITWSAVEVDSTGKFKGRELGNGYLYLTYESNQEQAALLHISGHSMVYVNGQPRTGDVYSDGWLQLPVQLKKGTNELYIRGSRFSVWNGISAKLALNTKSVILKKEDPTLPSIVLGNQQQPLWGALVVVNASNQPLTNLQFRSKLEGKEVLTKVPVIPAMTTRKVGFRIDPAGAKQKGEYAAEISLLQNGKALDAQTIQIPAVEAKDHYSGTFLSEIDGSVQYFGVAPQTQTGKGPSALFLSVHGAGVEAIGQARAYQPKDWGVVVTPTNRRPRGFNWEDWGRLDALEVFELAKKKFNPDPKQIYLTGHSMGGHGTWFLGATYPGKWAAIAPCAGYPTLAAYGSADGKIPEAGRTGMESLLLQASNSSNVLELAKNYGAAGVYIHHGDSDKVVSVDYARQMKNLLATFHKDFSYYEYPGGEHWFGNESVDWKPIFDYFKWHTIPNDSAVNKVNFSTASPAISSTYHWVSVLQQQQSLKYSRVQLDRDKGKKTITGKTENVATLSLALNDFNPSEKVSIALDGGNPVSYTTKTAADTMYLYRQEKGWQTGAKPALARQKGAVRNGTFKEPFNHKMIYVYGTSGNKEENEWAYNKARYDAEVWYYRGNGAVDIIADKDFKPAAYPNRGVILYGNASTNSAWKKLLAKSPIQVQRGSIKVGKTKYQGDDLGAYFMWPRADSKVASVAVVTGTGLKGMQAADANQYFAGGSGFPDYMVFSLNLLKNGSAGVKTAGFYGNDWSMENGQQVTQEPSMIP
ncbi:alpha/beta hydrolase-fold protein [Rufibacter hautae]|uniref:Prolyl oligopeptidase family serine peptidase n=1 Tax=Rufibacter hautae TaxID=2595005 RepID=A0A5B6THA7_9BACT|nr:alpha/beta hydrolase-fold protein [Rufibacter hautae]KAA3439781.1 prolyl oligopeptidase family serine peptidase [Rufibacter hautae]